jgi:hypothetical protein
MGKRREKVSCRRKNKQHKASYACAVVDELISQRSGRPETIAFELLGLRPKMAADAQDGFP